MLTEWIKGLMGYEAKSFVWMQPSVKRKNIPNTNCRPPCHWAVSSANWGNRVGIKDEASCGLAGIENTHTYTCTTQMT